MLGGYTHDLVKPGRIWKILQPLTIPLGRHFPTVGSTPKNS